MTEREDTADAYPGTVPSSGMRTRTKVALVAIGTAIAWGVVVVGVITRGFPGDPFGDAVGVKMNGDELLIRVKPCVEPPHITSIELDRVGEQGQKLWDIEAADASTTGDYQLGVTPPGFEERTGLNEPLQPGARYLLIVSFQEHANRPVLEFDPAQVPSDAWVTSVHRKLTDAQFERLDPCA